MSAKERGPTHNNTETDDVAYKGSVWSHHIGGIT